MLAARLYGPRDLRVEDVPEPKPPRGWVLVRTVAVGICGTDKAFYTGTYQLFRKPLIPGHEAVGIVEEGPREIQGELVVTEINLVEDWSAECARAGLYTHCPGSIRKVLGITMDGAMAEYFISKPEALHPIGDLDPIKAVYVEPLAAVLRAFTLHPLRPGENVAVIGTGPIALISAQVARLQGGKVTVYARRDSVKKRVFEKLGFHVETVDEIDLDKIAWEGLGYSAVIEATGSPRGLEIAVAIAAPRARIYMKSTHGSLVSFNQTLAVVKELELLGSRCGTFSEFREAIRLLKEGYIHVEISSVYALRYAREAFDKSLERDQFKVVVRAS
ncbi:Alcohol dehydrogenase GroES domain protein [Pyrolobus fumarii 1A]|uniref:Alcohol dehydrogenase GroES domain protein n=1 Tax=Pyrolobus fumarii (strain DSM 11204 / 1A) TaxID=694429 RepID=G0EF52_PYRF1|nr:alcohol dehydrogenase catalytic domain-containing protein [Pyrolobus fumarii]AEM38949.1 Alcohol dehydrogenase GroES domain protein [Pyrolobus fumarii 1A]